MDLEARKISFVQEFRRLQNEEIVNQLEKLLHEQKGQLLDLEMKPMSLDQFNKELDQSVNDVVQGRITSSQDLKSRIQKWD